MAPQVRGLPVEPKEAERARRDAADARAATRLALESADEAKAEAAAGAAPRGGAGAREAAAVRETVEQCRAAEKDADEAAAELRAAARDQAAAIPKPRRAPTLSEARIADDAASVDGASHAALAAPAAGDIDTIDSSQPSSVVVVHGGDAFASLQHKLEQSEDVANALRAEVAALRARPPPSPAYTSVEETLRERLRAAEADRKDRIQGRLREAVAKPASPASPSTRRGVDAAQPPGRCRGC